MSTMISGKTLGITDKNKQQMIELKVFPTKQPYVPYALAVSYISQVNMLFVKQIVQANVLSTFAFADLCRQKCREMYTDL
jgi:hypothetical protein